jgi:hypothetical protein
MGEWETWGRGEKIIMGCEFPHTPLSINRSIWLKINPILIYRP